MAPLEMLGHVYAPVVPKERFAAQIRLRDIPNVRIIPAVTPPLVSKALALASLRGHLHVVDTQPTHGAD